MSGIIEQRDADEPGTTRPAPLRQLLTNDVQILPWIVRWRVAILLACGVVFRLAQYWDDRRFWLDESSLADNIRGKTLTELFGALGHGQLAPAGFLVAEWAAGRLLGETTFGLRLIPFISAIAALFLFHRVALRSVRPEAVWIAVALFVLADDLIYYASELKQYSTDVAVSLACGLLALRIAPGEAGCARLAWFAVLGAVGVWFSHPSAFVLAGLGTVLITSALLRGVWRSTLRLSLVCVVWLASFAGVYAVSRRHLAGSRLLWVFWDFAFPPWPPSSALDLAWPVQRFAYLFANPVNFDTPLGTNGSALLALGLFLAGCRSLWTRGRREVLAMLTAPIAITMAAAYLRLYPFHGRLVLFLVPALLLLIAEGIARVLQLVGQRPVVRGAFVAFVLVLPALYALGHLVEPRQTSQRNSHGDRRPMSLEPSRFPL